MEPDAYFALGQQTLLFYVLRGRGRQSGAAAKMRLAQVARWRGNLMVDSKVYTDKGEALRDLGVSEDALEPIAP